MSVIEGLADVQRKLEHLVSRTDDLTSPLIREINELTGQNLDLQKYLDDLRRAIAKNRKVVVSVVGQVKYGKSTLLNALLFNGQQVLPKAATPMTARLSRIVSCQETETPGCVAEFYTKSEWSTLEHSKEKTDIEIVAAAHSKLSKNEISSILETRADFDLHEMEQYVAENGRFTDLVKYVEIRVAGNPYVDLEVVDTPGINDPVESREKQTREFLRQTDAVLFLLAPGSRFLDATDLELAIRELPTMGLCEGVIVISKMDSLSAKQREEFLGKPAGMLWKMQAKARRKAEEYCAGPETIALIEKFFNPENAVLTSALSYILGSKLKRNVLLDSDETGWVGQLKTSGWSSGEADDLINVSGIEKLSSEIDRKIVRRKAEILLNKPFSALMGEFAEVQSRTRRNLKEKEDNLKDLETQIDQLIRKREGQIEAIKAYEKDARQIIEALGKSADKNWEAPEVDDIPPLKSSILLAAECASRTRRALKQAFKAVRDDMKASLESCGDKLKGLPDSEDNLSEFRDEMGSLVKSLNRHLQTALNESENYVNTDIHFDWTIFDWIFGGGKTKEDAAREAVAIRLPEVNSDLEDYFENAVEEARKLVVEATTRLRKKIEDEKNRMRKEADQLHAVVNNKARELPALKEKWTRARDLLEQLGNVISGLTPLFNEVRDALEGERGREAR